MLSDQRTDFDLSRTNAVRHRPTQHNRALNIQAGLVHAEGRVPAPRQEGRPTDVSDGRDRRYPYHLVIHASVRSSRLSAVMNPEHGMQARVRPFVSARRLPTMRRSSRAGGWVPLPPRHVAHTQSCRRPRRRPQRSHAGLHARKDCSSYRFPWHRCQQVGYGCHESCSSLFGGSSSAAYNRRTWSTGTATTPGRSPRTETCSTD